MQCKLSMSIKQVITVMMGDETFTKLNHPGLEYAVVGQTGPSHAPSFEVAVTLNGVEFRGVGG